MTRDGLDCMGSSDFMHFLLEEKVSKNARKITRPILLLLTTLATVKKHAPNLVLLVATGPCAVLPVMQLSASPKYHHQGSLAVASRTRSVSFP